jgi:hypothetical protein
MMVTAAFWAIKLNRTPDTRFGARLNRWLDCGECSNAATPELPQWVDGPLTPQPNASSMGWGALGGVRRHPRQKENGCDGCVTKRRMAPACRPI